MSVQAQKTVSELLKGAFSQVFCHFKSVLFLVSPVLILGFIFSLLSFTLPEQAAVFDFFSAIFQVIIILSISVRWYRIQMGAASMQNNFFIFDKSYWFKMLGAQILLSLVCFLPAGIFVSLIILLFGASYATYAVAVLTVFVTLYVWHRIPFLLLYAAMGQKISLKKTWTESQGIWGRLILTNLILFISFFLIIFAFFFIFFVLLGGLGESSITFTAPILSLLINFSYLLLFMLNASIIVQLHKEATKP